MASYDDFYLWKRDRLQQFLRVRGIKSTGKRDELRALAYHHALCGKLFQYSDETDGTGGKISKTLIR